MEPITVNMESLTGYHAGVFESGLNSTIPTEQNCLFGTPFSSDNVVVIPMIQSRNGSDMPNLRIWDIDRNGFKFHMDEVSASNVDLTDDSGTSNYSKVKSAGNPHHVSETIAFIAFVC